MAGYWPSSFFAYVYKERGQYPAILTAQAWSIKDLLYGIKDQNMADYSCGTKPVSRAGKIAPSFLLG